jgi:hypothetical protein
VLHTIQIKHRDEVESPITDWLQEAYEFSGRRATKAAPQSATRTPGRSAAKKRLQSARKKPAARKAKRR